MDADDTEPPDATTAKQASNMDLPNRQGADWINTRGRIVMRRWCDTCIVTEEEERVWVGKEIEVLLVLLKKFEILKKATRIYRASSKNVCAALGQNPKTGSRFSATLCKATVLRQNDSFD